MSRHRKYPEPSPPFSSVLAAYSSEPSDSPCLQGQVIVYVTASLIMNSSSLGRDDSSLLSLLS